MTMQEPAARSKKALTAALIGNYVEWYEFTVYGFLAVTIGQLFFPMTDATTSLIASFAVFGGAFFTRPLGGLVFASIGDRFGRRNALASLLIVVSVATGAIGLLPTYTAVGIAAPISLIVLRLLQGFAFGGELAGTSTFIVEYAPAKRRGFFTTLIGATSGVGLITGALLVLALRSSLSPEAFQSWGWRIPFIVGFFLALFGLYIRLQLEDTPAFRSMAQARQVSQAPLTECVRKHFSTVLLMLLFTAPQSLYFYLAAGYMPTYLAREMSISPQTSLALILVLYISAIITCLCMGALMDKAGRRGPALLQLALVALGSIPAFLFLNTGSMAWIVVGVVVFGVILGFCLGVGGIIFSEIFPARVRYAGSSISSNAAQVFFGATIPILSTYLIATTGNKLAPSFYVAAVGAIAFITCYVFLPETSSLTMASPGEELTTPSADIPPLTQMSGLSG